MGVGDLGPVVGRRRLLCARAQQPWFRCADGLSDLPDLGHRIADGRPAAHCVLCQHGPWRDLTQTVLSFDKCGTEGDQTMAKRTIRRRKKAKRTTPPRPPSGTPTRPATSPRRDGMRDVPDNFHALYDRGLRSALGLRPSPAAGIVSASSRRLTRDVTGLEVHYDQITQLPNMIISKSPAAPLARLRRAGATAMAGPAPTTPEGAAVDFIRSRGDLWRLTAADTATVEVVSVSQPRQAPEPPAAARGRARAGGRATAQFDVSKLKTVNLIQRVEGTEVFNSDTTVAVNANNEVIAVAGPVLPGRGGVAPRGQGAARPARRQKARASSAAAEDAIARAAFDLTNVAYTAADFCARRSIRPTAVHIASTSTSAATSDARPVLRASRACEGRDVPARRRGVRHRLLHGAVDQGVPRVQLCHGRGRHAGRALPQEPHVARGVQISRAQHRRRRCSGRTTGRHRARRIRPARRTASRRRPSRRS